MSSNLLDVVPAFATTPAPSPRIEELNRTQVRLPSRLIVDKNQAQSSTWPPTRV